MYLSRVWVFIAAASRITAAQGDACCAFGGNGAAVFGGTGVIVLPGGTAPQSAPMALGSSGATAPLYSAVLVGPFTGATPSPDDSTAGWIVQQNDTHQTLYSWATGAWCNASYVALPDVFSHFQICRGGETNSSVFPYFSRSYTYNGGQFDIFRQSSNLDSTEGVFNACALVTVRGPGTGFGTGGWSLTMESGFPGQPPASWGAPPTWCKA